MSAVRVVRREDVAVPASELAQIDRLAEQLRRMQAAVERRRQAALTRQPAPTFPAGRDPLRLVPDITTLAFKIFYAEAAAANKETPVE